MKQKHTKYMQIHTNKSMHRHCVTRDGRISDPAIQIRLDFHYPVKSDLSWIACFTPDRISANYCVNISRTICQRSLLIVRLM